ncbi:uncharacterized protein K489DRAFT_151540 [Dissoconium aciculare CBS 342.82]|uniref:Uncharacterized protein n=1 Tax=Dissoconium aciculare CBS 342.82 TaxID=1314786 RepID=A0A6J3MBH5_9PEZI|nr:uncharacterized protein K489DRAFT_151540 [Dissoconium aciculare CBS 342.82]KAF1825218.1 hypothetical protein K489DRAFT_151540 [Dissoconium aciculare CBS 342.82]
MPRKINVEARQAVNELQNPSILDQVSRIIANVDDADRVIASLEAWQASLNPKTYEKIEPWNQEMMAAHAVYHAQETAIRPVRDRFEHMKRRIAKEQTTEELVELTRLAIEWGQVVLRAADGRLQFWRRYQRAYNLEGIKGHIIVVQNHLSAAEKAVESACKSYQSIYVKEGLRLGVIGPSVFR